MEHGESEAHGGTSFFIASVFQFSLWRKEASATVRWIVSYDRAASVRLSAALPSKEWKRRDNHRGCAPRANIRQNNL